MIPSTRVPDVAMTGVDKALFAGVTVIASAVDVFDQLMTSS